MFDRCDFNGSHSMFGGGSMMSGGIFMWILGIIILVTIIWLITNYTKKQSDTTSNIALRILDERYARGEIDEIEYSSKKSLLSK